MDPFVEPNTVPKDNKPKYIVFAGIGAIFLFIGVIGGYFWGNSIQSPKVNTINQSPFHISPIVETQKVLQHPGELTGGIYSDWKTYRDSHYKFSFAYPPSTSITEQSPVFAVKEIPQPLKLLLVKTPIEGEINIAIYGSPSASLLHKDFPFTEPCGSQYGKMVTNEEFSINGILLLHRRTFHDSYNDPVSMLTYGTRVDYCFLSGNNNLVIFRGAKGNLSFRNIYRQEDYLITLLSSLDIGVKTDD